MPAGISGVRVREEIKGICRNEKTDCSLRGGERTEQQGVQRQTESIQEALPEYAGQGINAGTAEANRRGMIAGSSPQARRTRCDRRERPGCTR